MKRLILLFILLPCLSLANSQTDPALIGDRTDALNYSHGFATGEKIVQRNIDFRTAAFSQGLYDALENKTPRLSEELMAQLTNVDNQGQAPEKAFRLPGQKYISENASKEGVVTLPSGVQYKVVKSGDGVESPKLSDSVLVNYKAATIDGTPFSSTYPLGIPTPEEIAVNEVVKGWTEALLLMHEGDKWEVTIPYYLAYRDAGPMAGQTIVVEIELVKIYKSAQ
ncbi:MAG: hypothetical protein C0623_02430 [Desulfuromonas sp.]|nr:MAG: hypothetical protein C0623_02430 [Desulfuromonas sp.]